MNFRWHLRRRVRYNPGFHDIDAVDEDRRLAALGEDWLVIGQQPRADLVGVPDVVCK